MTTEKIEKMLNALQSIHCRVVEGTYPNVDQETTNKLLQEIESISEQNIMEVSNI